MLQNYTKRNKIIMNEKINANATKPSLPANGINGFLDDESLNSENEQELNEPIDLFEVESSESEVH